MNTRKDKRLACAYEGFTCAVFVKDIGTFVDRCNSETIGVGDPVEDIRVNKASLFHVSSHARRVELSRGFYMIFLYGVSMISKTSYFI